MSKVEAMRALKDARRAEALKAAGSQATVRGSAPTATRSLPAASPKRTAASRTPVAAESPAAGLCGHRSMNGRSCTRPGGHSEKNHRYG